MEFLYHINYLAVIVSSIIFFVIGSLWYSVLFGSMWSKELELHNVVIKEPSKKELTTKMFLTFCANIVASLVMAYFVFITKSTTLMSGLHLGIAASIGFAGTAIALVFIWESKSLKLFLIDFGYSATGLIVSSIILSLWH